MKTLSRMGVVGSMVLAGAALLVTTGPGAVGAANAPRIKGTGSLNCVMAGKVKFTPALGAGSTPTDVKVAATLSSCGGSGSAATVTGGTVTGTISGTPAGDCGVTSFNTTGTLTVTYTVKTGKPRLASTTLSFNAVQSVSQDPGFEGQISGAVTHGSFPGDGSFMTINSTQASACSAKWTMGGGGSFELG